MFSIFIGNSKIIEYFNEPYNEAILILTKEGYSYIEEFQRLFNIYEATNSVNYRELLFLIEVNNS